MNQRVDIVECCHGAFVSCNDEVITCSECGKNITYRYGDCRLVME